MSVKEYDSEGFCDLHQKEKLIFTGALDTTWWECSVCRKEDWKNFYEFLEETSAKVELMPKWKGGGGKGVDCPSCNGLGYVATEPELGKPRHGTIEQVWQVVCTKCGVWTDKLSYQEASIWLTQHLERTHPNRFCSHCGTSIDSEMGSWCGQLNCHRKLEEKINV